MLLAAAALFFVSMSPTHSFVDASSTTSTTPDISSAIAAAVSYLQSKSFNPWSIMALSAAGNAPSTSSVSLALASTSTSTAIGLEAPIMAIAAIGSDPRTIIGGEDLVADLEGFVSTTTGEIGGTSTLNDDIFGLLALSAAGVSSSDPTVLGARNFLLNNQNVTNGGFTYVIGGTSDTNTTAAAVMALLATGSNVSDSAIQNAVKYLKSAQNPDGGFSYDPTSPYGTSTDASSDSWIISAINALGQSPTSSAWTAASGTDPVASLLSFQNASSGFFEYQSGSGEDSFSPVTTSYAVIALLGKFLPTAVITPVSTVSKTTATSTTSTATSTGIVVLVGGGSGGGGGGGGGSGGPAPVQVSYRIEGPSAELCAGTGQALTAMDVLADASSSCGASYHVHEYSFGSYVDQIGSVAAAGADGWLYLVNFVSPSVSAADYNVKQGDNVVWYYGDGSELPLTVTAPAVSASSGGGGSGVSASSSLAASSSSPSLQSMATTTPTSTAGEILGASTTSVIGELIDLEKELVTLEFKANDCAVAFNKNLYQGMHDPDVENLQRVLNYTSLTEVAKDGPGSPGNETAYFGDGTKNAIAAFQNIFADQILAPKGLSSGNGFVGSATRAVLNNLCTSQ